MSQTVNNRANVDSSKNTVLVVDDTPANLDVLVNYLKECGFKTLVASNGEVALERIKYFKPDIILLDAMMPGIDGFETCCRLKSNENTKDIPVIFMTALIDPEHKVKGFSVGAVDYITKPVQKEELLARVATHLKIHKYQEHLEKEVQKRTAELEERMASLKNEIFERKRVEDELRHLRNYLSNIIDSMPSVLIGVDKDGKVTQWNNTAEQTTGITADAAYGKLLSDVFPQMASEMNKITESIRTRETKQEQKRLRLLEKGNIYENVTIYPLIANGVEGAVIRIDDVSKEHELEEQLNHHRKMDAIGQLAGGVAHDFNNMLGGIISAAQLLKSPKRNIGEEGLKFADMILKAAIRAADLTAKLLAFGRKGRISFTYINIHNVIDDTVAILNRTVDKKIQLQVSKDAQNHTVVGDNSGLQNALINIGINAGHAMRDGGEIQIETKNIQLDKTYCDAGPFEIKPGEYIEIEIRDTGCGIPLENFQEIFEPFYTTKEKGEGTGLGLAAVYGTVQDHHGAISVCSEVGAGTSFHILLPCSEEGADFKQTDAEVIAGSGLILLVDDEEIIRTTGKHMLEEMGYEVLPAENGREAVEIFEKRHSGIDLVIMDMIMPEMNGREAFMKMKEVDKNCKIVIMSGFAKDESLDKLREFGLTGFIRKPFVDYELSQLLAEVLRTKAS